MSAHCPDCGAVASYGREISHKSDCGNRHVLEQLAAECAGAGMIDAALHKAEVVRLSSRVKVSGALIYPNPQVLVWGRAPWGWILIEMRDATEAE